MPKYRFHIEMQGDGGDNLVVADATSTGKEDQEARAILNRLIEDVECGETICVEDVWNDLMLVLGIHP